MAQKYQYSGGELYVQQKADVVKLASRVSRMVQDSADGFAQSFVQRQLFCFISSKDQKGGVWTSMLAGKHIGFAKFNNPKQLFFGRGDYHLFKDDILYGNISNNSSVGVLFIDLSTRQRQRLNGTLHVEENGLRLDIEQSFVNCPKYIQLRALDRTPTDSDTNHAIQKGSSILPENVKQIILSADTFYVGTAGKNNALDTSHRGGNPGFVKFIGERMLKIPDYVGNNMFISLGNMYEYPNTGLLFIDDKSRSILQLQGEAELVFDEFDEEGKHSTGGTGRYWYFKIQQYHLSKQILPYTWKLVELSPFNP